MANTNAPRGLEPIYHRLSVPFASTVHPYCISSSDSALYIGDPVVRTGTANTTALPEILGGSGFGNTFAIGTLPTVTKATAGSSNKITGVIVGFGVNANNLTQIYNPANQAAVAWLIDDPFVIFKIQADGAIPAATMGLNGNLIYTVGGSATTGLSGVQLDSGTTTAPTTTATLQLMIMRAINSFDNDTTITNPKIEVMINQTTENPGSVGALGI